VKKTIISIKISNALLLSFLLSAKYPLVSPKIIKKFKTKKILQTQYLLVFLIYPRSDRIRVFTFYPFYMPINNLKAAAEMLRKQGSGGFTVIGATCLALPLLPMLASHKKVMHD